MDVLRSSAHGNHSLMINSHARNKWGCDRDHRAPDRGEASSEATWARASSHQGSLGWVHALPTQRRLNSHQRAPVDDS